VSLDTRSLAGPSGPCRPRARLQRPGPEESGAATAYRQPGRSTRMSGCAVSLEKAGVSGPLPVRTGPARGRAVLRDLGGGVGVDAVAGDRVGHDLRLEVALRRQLGERRDD